MIFDTSKALENLFIYAIFLVILFLPGAGAFLFVWVLTTNVLASVIIAIVAQLIYVRFFW
jgi:hypothetical protein